MIDVTDNYEIIELACLSRNSVTGGYIDGKDITHRTTRLFQFCNSIVQSWVKGAH